MLVAVATYLLMGGWSYPLRHAFKAKGNGAGLTDSTLDPIPDIS